MRPDANPKGLRTFIVQTLTGHDMNMTAWMRHSLAIGLLVHGSCLAAPHQGLDEVHTIIVNYSDLDLTRPEGLRILHERIAVAARRACGPPNGFDSPDLLQYLGYQECVHQAFARAVRQISSMRPPSPK